MPLQLPTAYMCSFVILLQFVEEVRHLQMHAGSAYGLHDCMTVRCSRAHAMMQASLRDVLKALQSRHVQVTARLSLCCLRAWSNSLLSAIDMQREAARQEQMPQKPAEAEQQQQQQRASSAEQGNAAEKSSVNQKQKGSISSRPFTTAQQTAAAAHAGLCDRAIRAASRCSFKQARKCTHSFSERRLSAATSRQGVLLSSASAAPAGLCDSAL